MKLSMPLLLGLLSRVRVNILAVSQDNSWLIIGKTPHPRYFVGTKVAIKFNAAAINHSMWIKLTDFAQRYATPGSFIMIFWLAPYDAIPIKVAEVVRIVAPYSRCQAALYQLETL